MKKQIGGKQKDIRFIYFFKRWNGAKVLEAVFLWGIKVNFRYRNISLKNLYIILFFFLLNITMIKTILVKFIYLNIFSLVCTQNFKN